MGIMTGLSGFVVVTMQADRCEHYVQYLGERPWDNDFMTPLSLGTPNPSTNQYLYHHSAALQCM